VPGAYRLLANLLDLGSEGRAEGRPAGQTTTQR